MLNCLDISKLRCRLRTASASGRGEMYEGKCFRLSGLPDHPHLATILPPTPAAGGIHDVHHQSACALCCKQQMQDEMPRSNRREARIVPLQGCLCPSAPVSGIRTKRDMH